MGIGILDRSCQNYFLLYAISISRLRHFHLTRVKSVQEAAMLLYVENEL